MYYPVMRADSLRRFQLEKGGRSTGKVDQIEERNWELWNKLKNKAMFKKLMERILEFKIDLTEAWKLW